MTFLIKYKAIWITLIAWCLAVTLNQIFRGYPIIPPEMTPTGYWAIHIIIGSFIGAIIYAVVGVLKIIAAHNK